MLRKLIAAALVIVGFSLQAQAQSYGLRSSVDQVNWGGNRVVPTGTMIYLKYFISPPMGMGQVPVTFEWFVDGNSVGFQNNLNNFTSGTPGFHYYEAVGYNAAGMIVQPRSGLDIIYHAANTVDGERTSGSLGEVQTDYYFLFTKKLYGSTLPALGTERITGTYSWQSAPLAYNPPLPDLISSQPNFQVTGIHLSQHGLYQIGLFTPDNTVLDTITFQFGLWTWDETIHDWHLNGSASVSMRVIFRRTILGAYWEIMP